MYSIRYKGCIAKQDNKTLEVFVQKDGCPEMRCIASDRLSRKELRTYINRYLREVVGENNDSH